MDVQFYSNDGEGYWYALFMQENFPWFKLNGDNEKDWQWLRSVNAGVTYYLQCQLFWSGEYQLLWRFLWGRPGLLYLSSSVHHHYLV